MKAGAIFTKLAFIFDASFFRFSLIKYTKLYFSKLLFNAKPKLQHSRDLKSDHSKSRLFEGRIPNVRDNSKTRQNRGFSLDRFI